MIKYKGEGNLKRLKLPGMGIAFILSITLLLTACGNDDQANSNKDEDTDDLGEAIEYTITGIEPGSGTMNLANKTLEEYENLEGWELVEASTAGMLTELDSAIKNEDPIIVTGWNPHWMFASYELKYLEDPKGTFGEVENINTLTRLGLEEDMPSANTVLDRFHWEPEDMETVMLEAQDVPFDEAATNWIEENQDRVNEWTEGVEEVDGKSIELISTPWDSERASGEVMKLVLEELGFNVTLTPVDPAVMFEAIASGEGDATVAPWLPVTHGDFYETHKGDFVDLGENLTGAKIGLVVPAYMDIESIEELQPNE